MYRKSGLQHSHVKTCTNARAHDLVFRCLQIEGRQLDPPMLQYGTADGKTMNVEPLDRHSRKPGTWNLNQGSVESRVIAYQPSCLFPSMCGCAG